MNAPRTWRSHPLDGALLWFEPRSGLRVRWDGPETRSLKPVAPRFVMVGLTDRCNLSCSFCSRDRGRAERRTPDGAFELLSDLAWAGVLEVAFGGGEPLLFEGFDLLLERLAEETPLALHFTPNGLLLAPERLKRLRRHAGEIRLSLYQQTPWRALVTALAASQKPFGINLLVTPEVLPGLWERQRLRGSAAASARGSCQGRPAREPRIQSAGPMPLRAKARSVAWRAGSLAAAGESCSDAQVRGVGELADGLVEQLLLPWRPRARASIGGWLGRPSSSRISTAFAVSLSNATTRWRSPIGTVENARGERAQG